MLLNLESELVVGADAVTEAEGNTEASEGQDAKALPGSENRACV